MSSKESLTTEASVFVAPFEFVFEAEADALDCLAVFLLFGDPPLSLTEVEEPVLLNPISSPLRALALVSSTTQGRERT
jgi:hypothetical protein